MYRYILKTEYNSEVDELYLIVLHENSEAPQVINVPLWDDEVDRLIDYEITMRNIKEPNGSDDAPFLIDHLTNVSNEDSH